MKTIYVNDEQHGRLKLLACSQGKTIQELAEEVFNKYFKETAKNEKLRQKT